MIDRKPATGTAARPGSPHEDPVLRMAGVGRKLWAHENGDRFVERLRSEDTPPPQTPRRSRLEENLPETIWHRIKEHQDEPFQTARGLPFTFKVEGNGIWFFRNKKRVNRKLTRVQVEVAISRCPLKTTTEIKDLMDYAYLFALLTDQRIRGQAW